MPWTGRDASRRTKAANTPALKTMWARVANKALKEYADDGVAVRVANDAVRKARRKGT